MLELAFTDKDSVGKGRSFDCSTCLDTIKKKRRCEVDKWDFTFKDDIIFPISIVKGGNKYGFCPGKMTWESEINTKRIFDLLVLSSETNHLLYGGGLYDQPNWFIENLSWFAPRYKMIHRANEQKAMWGTSSGSNNRNPKRKN